MPPCDIAIWLISKVGVSIGEAIWIKVETDDANSVSNKPPWHLCGERLIRNCNRCMVEAPGAVLREPEVELIIQTNPAATRAIAASC